MGVRLISFTCVAVLLLGLSSSQSVATDLSADELDAMSIPIFPSEESISAQHPVPLFHDRCERRAERWMCDLDDASTLQSVEDRSAELLKPMHQDVYADVTRHVIGRALEMYFGSVLQDSVVRSAPCQGGASIEQILKDDFLVAEPGVLTSGKTPASYLNLLNRCTERLAIPAGDLAQVTQKLQAARCPQKESQNSCGSEQDRVPLTNKLMLPYLIGKAKFINTLDGFINGLRDSKISYNGRTPDCGKNPDCPGILRLVEYCWKGQHFTPSPACAAVDPERIKFVLERGDTRFMLSTYHSLLEQRRRVLSLYPELAQRVHSPRNPNGHETHLVYRLLGKFVQPLSEADALSVVDQGFRQKRLTGLALAAEACRQGPIAFGKRVMADYPEVAFQGLTANSGMQEATDLACSALKEVDHEKKNKEEGDFKKKLAPIGVAAIGAVAGVFDLPAAALLSFLGVELTSIPFIQEELKEKSISTVLVRGLHCGSLEEYQRVVSANAELDSAVSSAITEAIMAGADIASIDEVYRKGNKISNLEELRDFENALTRGVKNSTRLAAAKAAIEKTFGELLDFSSQVAEAEARAAKKGTEYGSFKKWFQEHPSSPPPGGGPGKILSVSEIPGLRRDEIFTFHQGAFPRLYASAGPKTKKWLEEMGYGVTQRGGVTVYHAPDAEALNALALKLGPSRRPYVEFYSAPGKVGTEEYLARWAKGQMVIAAGDEALHDSFGHVLGFAAMPKGVVEQSTGRANLLISMLKDPRFVLSHGKSDRLRDSVKLLIAQEVEKLDSASMALASAIRDAGKDSIAVINALSSLTLDNSFIYNILESVIESTLPKTSEEAALQIAAQNLLNQYKNSARPGFALQKGKAGKHMTDWLHETESRVGVR